VNNSCSTSVPFLKFVQVGNVMMFVGLLWKFFAEIPHYLLIIFVLKSCSCCRV